MPEEKRIQLNESHEGATSFLRLHPTEVIEQKAMVNLLIDKSLLFNMCYSIRSNLNAKSGSDVLSKAIIPCSLL